MMAMYIPGIMINAVFITMSALEITDRVTFCSGGSFYSGTVSLVWFGTMTAINLWAINAYIYLYQLVRDTNGECYD